MPIPTKNLLTLCYWLKMLEYDKKNLRLLKRHLYKECYGK